MYSNFILIFLKDSWLYGDIANTCFSSNKSTSSSKTYSKSLTSKKCVIYGKYGHYETNCYYF